jgi:hypothetical protein
MHLHSIVHRWLFAVFVLSALSVTGQPTGDSIPEPQNQLSIDVQFLGRGESRYGGLPEAPNEEDEDEKDDAPAVVSAKTRITHK